MARLNGALCIDYVNILLDIKPPSHKSRFGLAVAPASERAEAMLKTIGKWKDDPFPVSPVPHLPRRYRSCERAEAMVE